MQRVRVFLFSEKKKTKVRDPRALFLVPRPLYSVDNVRRDRKGSEVHQGIRPRWSLPLPPHLVQLWLPLPLVRCHHLLLHKEALAHLKKS